MSTSTNFARVKDIESAANRSKTKFTELNSSIGTLANLTTGNKTNLVGALNEIAANSGGGSGDNGVKYFGFWNVIKVVSGSILTTNGFNIDFQELLADPNSYISTWGYGNYINHFVIMESDVKEKINNTSELAGTVFAEAPLNSIISYQDNQWNIYTPRINDLILISGKIYQFNGTEWIESYDLYDYNRVKNVFYIFDAGYGDTLPTTATKGSKFLKQEDGALKIYTAVADDTWDDGYLMVRKMLGNVALTNSTKSYNYYKNGSSYTCFKFNYNSDVNGIETITNPLPSGSVVVEVGTGDVYTYYDYGSSLKSFIKHKNSEIRRVHEIIPQVYDTAPSSSNAPAESKILMINASYKYVYTDTNTNGTKWSKKSSVNMPKNKGYLSLADKRIYLDPEGNTHNYGYIPLRFAPLLDGEMFFYEGDKSYYIYRYATQSFEKVATSAATLTPTFN